MSFTTKKLLTKSKRSILTEGDPYWDNTVLLLHGDGANNAQNNTFLDSANNLTITRNGTPTQGSFSPFALNGVAYSPTLHGGSGYFNGSTDYLSTSDILTRTGNFTIECWVNSINLSVINTILGRPDLLELYISSTALSFAWRDGVGPNGWGGFSTSFAFQTNRWYHIVVSRNGSTFLCFINGTRFNIADTAYNGSPIGNYPLYIGANLFFGNRFFNGYISNFRYTNGAVLYTSNFSVPTSPVTRTSNGGATPSIEPTSGQVSLLCDFTNAGIIDHTEKNVLTTVGDAKVSTSVVKYGTGAMYFDGTGDYLTAPASNDFNFANGTPFTVEFWANPSAYKSGSGFDGAGTIISTGKVFNAGWRIEMVNQMSFYTYNNGTVISTPISLNVWTHIAVVHDGTTTRMYKDGILIGSANATWSASVSELVIGALMSGSFTYYYNGYLDDLRITKGVARYTADFTRPTRAFPDTPPTASFSDPFFRNTSLLLHGDGTNGAQNNTFRDSANNITITRNGTPTQGSFTPYGNLWSNDFNGGGNYFIIPQSNDFNFGSGNFTIECWFYANQTLSGYSGIFVKGTSGDFGRYTFIISNNGTRAEFWVNKWGVSGPICGSSTIITDGKWHHLAVVRNNNVFRFYVDGQAGSVTNTWTGSIDNSSATPYIGVDPFDFNRNLNAIISNLRVVKGTAVYTSNFTPPISPLTAIAGTSLLTCQSNRFADNSSNNFTITVNGNVSVSTEAPFSPTSEYSITTDGGSGYFNGSTDWLTVPANSVFNFSTGDFAIEYWVNPRGFTYISRIIFGPNNVASSYTIDLNTNGSLTVSIPHSPSAPVGLQSSAGSIPLNTWTHIAITCNSGTGRLFINGNKVDEKTITRPTSTTGNNLNIGYDPSLGIIYGYGPFQGYISNFRLTKGTAVYTSNFTPPTSPVTLTSNGGGGGTAPTSGQVSLLCDFTNAGIFDNTKKNNLVTEGNAQISTLVKKFGTGSMYFPNTTSKVPLIPTGVGSTLDYGTGSFTIELWYHLVGFSTFTSNKIFTQAVFANNNLLIDVVKVDRSLLVYMGNGFLAQSSANVIPLNTWCHIALVRSGSNVVAYVDGSSVFTATNSSSIGGGVIPCINGYAHDSGGYGGVCYIDDLRITKGVARYTADFTRPTRAFPDK
jgi:hypothetical protein